MERRRFFTLHVSPLVIERAVLREDEREIDMYSFVVLSKCNKSRKERVQSSFSHQYGMDGSEEGRCDRDRSKIDRYR